jgi:channel protein (hemolysin III family)
MGPDSAPDWNHLVSSLIHFGGAAILGTLAWRTLWRGRQFKLHLFSIVVFFAGAGGLLCASGTYHLLAFHSSKAIFQRLDHAAIFCLIAASFTPIHTILFKGWRRWVPLGVVWGMAAVGVILKLFFFEDVSEAVGLGLYLGMGWSGAISGVLLWWLFPYTYMTPLFWGGVSYTVGALIEFSRSPHIWPGFFGPHEIFHVMVLVGITFHWHFIHRIAAGQEHPSVAPFFRKMR